MEYPLDLQSVRCVLIRIDYEERLKLSIPQPWYRYNILMVLENGYQSLQEFDSFFNHLSVLFSLYKIQTIIPNFDYFRP